MSEKTVRAVRLPDELWNPFVLLTDKAEGMAGAAVIRRFVMSYLEEFRVFWAPVSKDGDDLSPHAAFYECEECNAVHRLDGSDRGPTNWGCSPIKARADRIEKAATR